MIPSSSSNSYDPHTACHICHNPIQAEKKNSSHTTNIFQRPFHQKCLTRWEKITPNEKSAEKIKRVFSEAKAAFAFAFNSKEPITHKPKLETVDISTEKLKPIIQKIDDLYCMLTHYLFPVDATNNDQRETLYLLLIGLKYGLSVYSELMVQKSYQSNLPHHQARINYYFDMYDSLYDLALYFITFEENPAPSSCKTQRSTLTRQKDELEIDNILLGILRAKINNQTQSNLDVILKEEEVRARVDSIEDNPELQAALIKELKEIGAITPPSESSTDWLETQKRINQTRLAFKARLIDQTVQCLLNPIGQKPPGDLFPAEVRKTVTNFIDTNPENAFKKLLAGSGHKSQSDLINSIDCSSACLELWKSQIVTSRSKQKITLQNPGDLDERASDSVVKSIDHCRKWLDFAKSFVSTPKYRQHTIPEAEKLQIVTSLKTLCGNDQTKESDYATLVQSKKAYFDNPQTCTRILRDVISLADQGYSKQNLFTLFHFLTKNISSLNFFSDEYAELLSLEYRFAGCVFDEHLKSDQSCDTIRPYKTLYDELHVKYLIFINCALNNKSHYDKNHIESLQSRSKELLSYFITRHTMEPHPPLSPDQIKHIESLRSIVYAFINALSRRAALCFMGCATNSNYSERYANASLNLSANPIEAIAKWTLLIENTRTAQQLQTQLKKMHTILSSQKSALFSEEFLTIKHAITGALQFFQLSPLCSSPPPGTPVRFFDIPCEPQQAIRDFNAHIALTRSSLSELYPTPSFKERMQNHEAVYSVLTDYSDAVDNFYHLQLYYNLLQEYLVTIQQLPREITDQQFLRFEVIYFEFYILLSYSRCKQASQNRIEPYIVRFEAALGALELEICKAYRSFLTVPAFIKNTDKTSFFQLMILYHLNSSFLLSLQTHHPTLLFSALNLTRLESTANPRAIVTLIDNTLNTLTNRKDNKEFFQKSNDGPQLTLCSRHYAALFNRSKTLIQKTPPLPQQTGEPQSLSAPLSPKQLFFYLKDLAQLIHATKFSLTSYDVRHLSHVYKELLYVTAYDNLLICCQENISTIHDKQVRIELICLIFQLFKRPIAQNANYRSLLHTLLTDLSELNKEIENSDNIKAILSSTYCYYYPLYYYVSCFIKHHPHLIKQSDADSFFAKNELFKSTFIRLTSHSFCQASEQFFSEIIRICFSLQPEHAISCHNTISDTELESLLSYSKILHDNVHTPIEAINCLLTGLAARPSHTVTLIFSSTIAFLSNTMHHRQSELISPEMALKAIVDNVKDVSPSNQNNTFLSSITAGFDDPKYMEKMIVLLSEKITPLTPRQRQNILVFMNTQFKINYLYCNPTFIHVLSATFSETIDHKEEKTRALALLFLHMALYAINHPKEFGSESLESITQTAITLQTSLQQPTSKAAAAQKIPALQEALLSTLARICYRQTHLPQSPADWLIPSKLAQTKNPNAYLDLFIIDIKQINHKNTFTQILTNTISFLRDHATSEPSLNICIAHCTAALNFCQTFEMTLPHTSTSLQTSLQKQTSATPRPTPPPKESSKKNPADPATVRAIIEAKNKAQEERQERDNAAHVKAQEDIAATNKLRELKRKDYPNVSLPKDPKEIVVFAPRTAPAHLLTTATERHERGKVNARAALQNEGSEAYYQNLTRFIKKKAQNSHKTTTATTVTSALPPVQPTTHSPVTNTQSLQTPQHSPLAKAPSIDTTNSVMLNTAPAAVSTFTVTPLSDLPSIYIPCDAKNILEKFKGNAFISGGYPAAYILNILPNDIDIMYRGNIKDLDCFVTPLGFFQNPKVENLFTRRGIDGELDIDVYCWPENTDFIEVLKQKDISLTALLVNDEGRICDPLKVIGDFDLPHLKFFGDLGERVSSDPIKLLRLIHYSRYKALTAEQKSIITKFMPELVNSVRSGKVPFGALRKQLQVLFLRGNANWYFNEYYDLFKYLLPFTPTVFDNEYILYSKLYMTYIFEDFDALCKDKDLRDKFRDQLLAILIFPETLTSKSPDRIISDLCDTLLIPSDTVKKPVLVRYLSYHREQYLFMLANLRQTYSQRLLIKKLEAQPSELSQEKHALAELEASYDTWRKELTKTIHGCIQPSSAIYSATSAAASDAFSNPTASNDSLHSTRQ